MKWLTLEIKNWNERTYSRVKEKKNIHNWAGVSGLIAVKVLEENGYFPTLIESSDDVGRLQTIVKEGYQLDKGFQVLLTAYPKPKNILITKN